MSKEIEIIAQKNEEIAQLKRSIKFLKRSIKRLKGKLDREKQLNKQTKMYDKEVEKIIKEELPEVEIVNTKKEPSEISDLKPGPSIEQLKKKYLKDKDDDIAIVAVQSKEGEQKVVVVSKSQKKIIGSQG